jgi:hypothetical protein
MEWGYDAVLLNTAVALSEDPVAMAGAFSDAVNAGHAAWRAGAMAEQTAAQHPCWARPSGIRNKARLAQLKQGRLTVRWRSPRHDYAAAPWHPAGKHRLMAPEIGPGQAIITSTAPPLAPSCTTMPTRSS